MKNILSSISPNLEYAAENLGSSKWQVFWKVIFPMIRPGLAGASLLVAISVLADFGNPIIIAGSYSLLPTEAYMQIDGMYNLTAAAVLATVLIVPTLILYMVQHFWVNGRKYTAITGKSTTLKRAAPSRFEQWFFNCFCFLFGGLIVLIYGTLFWGAFSKIWGVDWTFTLQNFLFIFSGTHVQELVNSISFSFLASLGCAVFALFSAYLVQRFRVGINPVLDFLVTLPGAIPGVFLGIGFILAFNNPPFMLTGTAAIIILAFLIWNLPMGYRAGVAAMQQLDVSIEKASLNLGASHFGTFCKIILPLMKTGQYFFKLEKRMNMSEHLILKNINKNFGSVQAVNDVSLTIQRGELVTLLGPSGCGKTTTLHMIAGFVQPDSGEIVLGGRDITYLPAYQRKTPFVFQEYALFPHLNVFENVAYGLKVQKWDRQTIRARVEKILNHLGLPQVAERFPNQLSGGQQQRIALARALVLDPEVLLLDEPLSNLDAKLRLKVRYEIKELRRQFDITTIFVTHDQEEALSISDKIAVMNKGIVEQFGDPSEIYYQPKNEFVAGFIGETNFLDVKIAHFTQGAEKYHVRFEWRDRLFQALCHKSEIREGQHRKLLLRPEAINMVRPDQISPDENYIAGKSNRTVFWGQSCGTGWISADRKSLWTTPK